MTYKELEEQMNKWWVELESQEKVFLEQATRVNAWDRILIENGTKVCFIRRLSMMAVTKES